MNMEDVKTLMKEAGWGLLATSDGRKVGVRPMGGLAWFGKELWCATFKASEKIAQLEKVPYAEYCFARNDGKHVRIAGPCEVSSDDGDKLKLYKAVPVLAEHIQDPASPDYVVIRMKPERVRIMAATELAYEDVEL